MASKMLGHHIFTKQTGPEGKPCNVVRAPLYLSPPRADTHSHVPPQKRSIWQSDCSSAARPTSPSSWIGLTTALSSSAALRVHCRTDHRPTLLLAFSFLARATAGNCRDLEGSLSHSYGPGGVCDNSRR